MLHQPHLPTHWPRPHLANWPRPSTRVTPCTYQPTLCPMDSLHCETPPDGYICISCHVVFLPLGATAPPRDKKQTNKNKHLLHSFCFLMVDLCGGGVSAPPSLCVSSSRQTDTKRGTNIKHKRAQRTIRDAKIVKKENSNRNSQT